MVDDDPDLIASRNCRTHFEGNIDLFQYKGELIFGWCEAVDCHECSRTTDANGIFSNTVIKDQLDIEGFAVRNRTIARTFSDLERSFEGTGVDQGHGLGGSSIRIEFLVEGFRVNGQTGVIEAELEVHNGIRAHTNDNTKFHLADIAVRHHFDIIRAVLEGIAVMASFVCFGGVG